MIKKISDNYIDKLHQEALEKARKGERSNFRPSNSERDFRAGVIAALNLVKADSLGHSMAVGDPYLVDKVTEIIDRILKDEN